MDKILTSIKDRILQIADFKRVAKEKFFKELDFNYSNFKGNAKKSSLSADSLAKILTIHSDINPDWLIFGTGQIFRSKNIDQNNTVLVNEMTNEYKKNDEEKNKLMREIRLLEDTVELQKFKIHTLQKQLEEQAAQFQPKNKNYPLYTDK